MSEEIIGNIHSIETCGTVDGPGLRFVAFLQGCPLRCVYCHNPDTWDVNHNIKTFTADGLMKEIVKYKSFIKNGGITFSGGEPCLQANFVREVFKLAKDEGLHTALDTSGAVINENVKDVLEYTDLVLLDIKSINPEKFKYIASIKIDKTLKFLEYLREKEIKTWIRHVLVPGITDNEKDLEELSSFIEKYDNIERIDILPFHKHGEHKWEALGMTSPIADTQPPSSDSVKKAKIIMKKSGKVVR